MSKTMRMNILKTLIVILANTSLLFWGCQEKTGIDYSKQITIGFIGPLTGPVADLGAEMLRSAELAVKSANKLNPDLKLKIIAQDDGMNATQASTKAKSLIDQNQAVAIIGAGTTSQVKAEISAIRGRNIPLITPTATETDLTSLGNYIFRVIPSNKSQAVALVNFARTHNIKNVGIMFQLSDDYSVDLTDIFKKLLQESGGQIATEIGFESDETDFKAQLSKLSRLKIDAIVCFAQHVQVSRVVLRANEIKINKVILSGETAYTEKLIETVGSVNNLYVAGSSSGNDKQRDEFENEFAAKYGNKPGPYGAYAYDAVNIFINILEKEKPDNGKGFINDLKSMAGFTGVTGNIEFDKLGDINRSYDIYRLENHSFIKLQSSKKY